MPQLTKKLKRSASFVRVCLVRFSIKQLRLKSTDYIYYDVSQEKMKLIEEFSNSRRKYGKKRSRKTDK